jgi:MFS family permease
MTAAMALSTDLVDPIYRGKVVGFRNFVGYIFTGLGMLLGNFLYVSVFPQMPFFLTLALVIPEIVIVIFFVHEAQKQQSQV